MSQNQSSSPDLATDTFLGQEDGKTKITIVREEFSHKREFDFEGFASLFYLPKVGFPLSPSVSLFNPRRPNSPVSFIEIGNAP